MDTEQEQNHRPRLATDKLGTQRNSPPPMQGADLILYWGWIVILRLGRICIKGIGLIPWRVVHSSP